jgi:transcription elongation factor S-II
MRTIAQPDEFRQKIVLRIHDKLKNEKNANNLERGVFNYALKEADTRKVVKKWDNPYFVTIYLDRMRSIFQNINESLIQDINNGAIKPQDIAFMSHQELKPEKWEKMIIEKIKRDKNKYETTIEASTDTFTCRKCRSKKCTFTQVQTRSADEPMTTFVNCISCGNHWKC